jgi:hypothetical protein
MRDVSIKLKQPQLSEMCRPAHPELDQIIQFWLEYWKRQGLKFPNIDPLLIKTFLTQ